MSTDLAFKPALNLTKILVAEKHLCNKVLSAIVKMKDENATTFFMSLLKYLLLCCTEDQDQVYGTYFNMVQECNPSLLRQVIELLPSSALESGFFLIRDLCLQIKRASVANDSSKVSDFYNIEFLNKINLWVQVCTEMRYSS